MAKKDLQKMLLIESAQGCFLRLDRLVLPRLLKYLAQGLNI